MQGSTRGQFVSKYANELIDMQKCCNLTTEVGMSVKFGQKKKKRKEKEKKKKKEEEERERKKTLTEV